MTTADKIMQIKHNHVCSHLSRIFGEKQKMGPEQVSVFAYKIAGNYCNR